MIGIAGLSCDHKALTSTANAGEPSSAAVATPASGPAPAAVTPRTESPDVAKNLSKAFAATAKALAPSVVRIDVRAGRPPIAEGGGGFRNDPFGGGVPPMFRRFFNFGGPQPDFPGPGMPGPVAGTGSGIVIDGAGNIVTNNHVVLDGAAEIKVTLSDGQEIPAKLVGRDKRTDVAVIRLDRIPNNLVAARLGDSDRIEVGEWVLAIGSPLGLEQTVTAGIVSGKGHVGRFVQMSGDRVQHYIQTDAKINPGNSGGPLVNLDGNVVGLNTLIRTGAGGAYGFAVPINEVRRVARALITEGRVRYPFLGVSVRDIATLDQPAKERLGHGAPTDGAYVAEVTPGSPAALAGIKPGDVITHLDGESIKTSSDVVDYVSSRAIGATVAITIFRDGSSRQLRATLAPAPGEADEPERAPKLGLSLQTLTPDIAGSLGLPPASRGAAIADVADGSPAARAGLVPGDVILDVDRRPVASADEATRLLGDGRNAAHLVRVYGRSGVRFVTIGRTG
ncbi:MAG TPA: trypsin-like peptidase domain-containing protein [Polyangia bacterium]|nr:trypsin-like peptidase domain-containing protein [Polyangia bacterium]